jgi:hypothetical protein
MYIYIYIYPVYIYIHTHWGSNHGHKKCTWRNEKRWWPSGSLGSMFGYYWFQLQFRGFNFGNQKNISLLVASRFSLRIYHIINFVYVPTFVAKFVGLRTSYGFASFTPSFNLLRSKSDCYDCEKFDPIQTMDIHGSYFLDLQFSMIFFGQLDWNFTKACDTWWGGLGISLARNHHSRLG